MPAGAGSGSSDGGAFAGLLLPGAVPAAGSLAAPATEVASTPVPLEAELLPVEGEVVEPVVDATGSASTAPSLAQIIAAAQVTPIGPMLANAPRLTPSYAEAVPATPSATTIAGPATATTTGIGTTAAAGIATEAGTGAVAGTGAGTGGGIATGQLAGPVGTHPGPPAEPSLVPVDTPGLHAEPSLAPDATAPRAELLPAQGDVAGQGSAGGATPTEGPTATHPAADQHATDGPAPAAQPEVRGSGENAPTSTNSQASGHTGGQADQAGSQAGSQAAAPPSAGTQPTTAQTTPVTGLTPAAQAAPTAPAGTTVANPVAGQVFPEVTRLVSRGDGTRRITLQLSPEALGDVRVVLTVRNGEVQVRMSGGEQAQQALLAGAPELHRLLDLAGAASSQIQVGTQSSTNALDQSLDQHTRQHAQDGELQHQDHRTAGTRDGDTSARDGAPRGTHPHPATNPGTRTRIAGVDVTM